MKKILLGLMVLLLVSCNQDALTYYLDANEKTEEIERAKSSLEMTVDFEFGDAVDADAEMITLLEGLSYTSERIFDKTLNQRIVRQYLGNDGFGFDTIYYLKEDEEYIKIPFAGKYLDLKALESSEIIEFSQYDEAPFTDETLTDIKEAWLNLVNEDDVVNLGDEVIDTPEGEVKVKKLVVNFSHDQIVGFLNVVLDVVAKDEKFRESITTFPVINIGDEIEISEEHSLDLDEAIEGTRSLLEYIVVNEFKMVTYIDIDDYIIESQYDVSVSFVEEMKDYVEGIDFKAVYQIYDLHEKNTFHFPEITEMNTTDLDTLIEDFEIEIPQGN